MPHYSQNIQSFLTGRFKILYMIFKSNFNIKNKTKEFSFLTYFYGRFSQKDVRVWEKTVLLVKVDADCLGGGEFKTVL